MTEFRNIDLARWPQKPRVEFERIMSHDDDASPDDWEIDPDRRAAFMDGQWSFIGIQAKATIYVPIGGTSFSVYTLTSPGLWGIEDDSGEEYLNEVFEEEKAALIAAIKAMAEGVQA